jgi:hypothetical protein
MMLMTVMTSESSQAAPGIHMQHANDEFTLFSITYSALQLAAAATLLCTCGRAQTQVIENVSENFRHLQFLGAKAPFIVSHAGFSSRQCNRMRSVPTRKAL